MLQLARLLIIFSSFGLVGRGVENSLIAKTIYYHAIMALFKPWWLVARVDGGRSVGNCHNTAASAQLNWNRAEVGKRK